MQESGLVTKVEGATAFIQFKRSSACGKCCACGMLKDMSEHVIELPNVLGAKPGDRVVVELSARRTLLSSGLAYLFPLIFLFIGVFLGYYIGRSYSVDAEIAAAAGGLVLTALAFLILRLLDPLFKRRLTGTFRMTHILKTEE